MYIPDVYKHDHCLKMEGLVKLSLVLIICIFPQKSVRCIEHDTAMALAECSLRLNGNQRCYNSLWCASLLSAPRYTEKYRGCQQLYWKFECLQDLFKSQSQAYRTSEEKLKEFMTEFEELIKRVEKNIELLRHDIGRVIKDEVEESAGKTDIEKEKVSQQKKTVDMHPHTFNKAMLSKAFLMFVVLLAINNVILYVLVKRTFQPGVSTTNRTPQAKGHANMRQFLKERAPEPAVCIISFDEARTNIHQRLLDSVKLPNCKVYTCVIRRHEHIKALPRCKVYLMCTEFNERHVIIEEEGLVLGDLHRKTYEAARTLGGCLIILYTKDPGSRQLKNNNLYNTDIHCVTSQPELMVLNSDGRFFSLHDNLTPYQKTQLRLKIAENL